MIPDTRACSSNTRGMTESDKVRGRCWTGYMGWAHLCTCIIQLAKLCRGIKHCVQGIWRHLVSARTRAIVSMCRWRTYVCLHAAHRSAAQDKRTISNAPMYLSKGSQYRQHDADNIASRAECDISLQQVRRHLETNTRQLSATLHLPHTKPGSWPYTSDTVLTVHTMLASTECAWLASRGSYAAATGAAGAAIAPTVVACVGSLTLCSATRRLTLTFRPFMGVREMPAVTESGTCMEDTWTHDNKEAMHARPRPPSRQINPGA